MQICLIQPRTRGSCRGVYKNVIPSWNKWSEHHVSCGIAVQKKYTIYICAIPCCHSLWMENICDSNEPFELYAINLCETLTERDYWGALLDKHHWRGRLVWRSDLIKASLKKTSFLGVSFVYFFVPPLSSRMVQGRWAIGKQGLWHCRCLHLTSTHQMLLNLFWLLFFYLRKLKP